MKERAASPAPDIRDECVDLYTDLSPFICSLSSEENRRT